MISIPFSGNKRYSYKFIREIVLDGDYKRVYEPFGGSCVLSVNLIRNNEVEKAVANDYDRFFDLYPEYLDLKDEVVRQCEEAGLEKIYSSRGQAYKYDADGNKVLVDSELLNMEDRKILQDIIERTVPKEYWKYFFLGSNFVYSAASSKCIYRLNQFKRYGRELGTAKQRQYLEELKAVTLEHLDWRDFIEKYRNELDHDALLILDPPYVNHYQGQYEGQFSIKDARELVSTVITLGCDFIYFGRDLEHLERLMEGTGCEYTIHDAGAGGTTGKLATHDMFVYARCRND